ncbi:MAG TPA: phosphotransferase [Solirubrobacter sp.]|nr:phosphotransferase [Solirubrobacter sp.]
MHEWSPEQLVDETRARRLIAEQCFEPRTLRPLGEGWDNTVWLVDERWAFRFPRRELAVPGVRREIALLGTLADVLPLPIPQPVWVGAPSDAFPWPFFGAPVLAGREAPEAEVDRAALGRPLGEFLSALHAARVDVSLPRDPMGRGHMPVRVDRTLASLRDVAPYWEAPRGVYDALEDARELSPPGRVVVHGDLHVRHLLIDGGAISGVIDWGDACHGDPCIDLVLYWALLSEAGRAAFREAYGPVTEEQLLCGRVLAWNLGAVLLVYAVKEGFAALAREVRAGLERTTG